MESFTVQIGTLTQTLFSNIQATGFLVPEAEHLPHRQSSLEKDVSAFATVHFSPNFLSRSLFSK